MASFILRNLDPEFWARVQAKAIAEGTTVKAVILRLLTQWLGVILLASLCAACGDLAPTAPTRTTLAPPSIPVTICAPEMPVDSPPLQLEFPGGTSGQTIHPPDRLPRVILCP
jgi:hypothetical protein